MIKMAMRQNDIFDVFDIVSGETNIFQDVIDIGLLRGIDQDMALRRGEKPHRDVAGTDIPEIVENLGGLDTALIGLVVHAAFAIGLAQRLAPVWAGANKLCRHTPAGRQNGCAKGRSRNHGDSDQQIYEGSHPPTPCFMVRDPRPKAGAIPYAGLHGSGLQTTARGLLRLRLWPWACRRDMCSCQNSPQEGFHP